MRHVPRFDGKLVVDIAHSHVVAVVFIEDIAVHLVEHISSQWLTDILIVFGLSKQLKYLKVCGR